MPLTDEELRAFINVTPEEFAKIKPRIGPKERATYEAMHKLCGDIELWEAGLGPKPTNAIICGPRQVRRA